MGVVVVERKILEKNDAIASELRHTFEQKNILVLNLLSSPGSGKTSLIEKTITTLKDKVRTVVIVGDVQTDNDAQRIGKLDIPVVQIITNGACHLEANLVRNAFSSIDEKEIDLLFIENVGNLVCPAGFDLGEKYKVVMLSVTEGDDKPLKYPAVFRNASVFIINKIDLLPYLNSNIEEIKRNALSINPHLKIFELSCTNSEGISKWCDWLISNTKK